MPPPNVVVRSFKFIIFDAIRRQRTSSSSRTGARRTQAARSGAKSTGTSARKAPVAPRSGKSGATATRAREVRRREDDARREVHARSAATAKTAARGGRHGKTARAGAKGTATPARPEPRTPSPAPRRRAPGPPRQRRRLRVYAVAEQLVRARSSRGTYVMLTREPHPGGARRGRVRGRVTRKDANDLVSELVRRGRVAVATTSSRGRESLAAARRLGGASARATPTPSDRIVRGADRARRAAGVGRRSRSSATTTSTPPRCRPGSRSSRSRSCARC